MSVITIREEAPDDRAAVRAVNTGAFSRRNEADLVECLHEADAAVVALVALRDTSVVGHILFSPVAVASSASKRLLGLAPLAITPVFQRQGIGHQLVREGLRRCAAADYDAVVVLGQPEYYSRFGFGPASAFGLRCEYDVPAEAFMALELQARSLSGLSGVVRYHPLFNSV